ncbi:MAG: RNA 2',3'-cyclic phosphodiesterase [bacterium]|nr:RNA 2',3'-cyclic phosphodiesterase [bacterium]
MGHRIFIAVNFPKDVKESLNRTRDEFPELPCRWTKKENLHLTLLFLGYASDEELLETCEIVRKTCSIHKPFVFELNRISYGPPGNPEKKQGLHGAGKLPRMVWASGKAVKELSALRQDLENSLFEKVVKDSKDNQFSPHVTLARIKQWQFREMELEEIPEIDKEISLKIPVESIEVMESELAKEGPEYSILESCPLSS